MIRLRATRYRRDEEVTRGEWRAWLPQILLDFRAGLDQPLKVDLHLKN
jgi:hypothetical protein